MVFSPVSVWLTWALRRRILAAPSAAHRTLFRRVMFSQSYLKELEEKYKLALGFNTRQEVEFLNAIKTLINNKDLKSLWKMRANKMLEDKIDVTTFIIWFIQNYPESFNVMKKTPDYQYNFR